MLDSPIRFDPEGPTLRLLDQRKLPEEERWIECPDAASAAEAIREMAVRGAPAIGIAAGYGVALALARPTAGDAGDAGEIRERFEGAARLLLAARPTAVNLAAAIERQRSRLSGTLAAGNPADLGERAGLAERAARALLAEADAIAAEDVAANRRIGELGRSLLPAAPAPTRFLTHCNTGSLATGGYGTALGIVRSAAESGRRVEVFACETRPRLQGARLTAWELLAAGIPVTLITDGTVGALLARERVDAVVVGADRIAANGDTANKIGTYQAAVLAREHGVPFWVAAPFSTVDLATADGAGIPIEERSPSEVTELSGTRVAPPGAAAWNPAFDVTPARLISAIVTERGIARPPYRESLAALAG